MKDTWYYLVVRIMLIFFVPAPFSCNHLWFKQTFFVAAKRNMMLPNWTWNMVDHSG